MKIVSIIIPVHVTEKYLDTCLQSIYKQRYENIEIIIVNNGSDQSFVQYLEEIAQQNSQMKLVHVNENQSVGYARNVGIKHATGEYIYFLDSDDYIPEETISLLTEHINNNNMILGSIKTTQLSSSFAVIFDGLYNVENYTTNRFKLIKDNSTLNCLFRKDYILKHELTFSEVDSAYSDLFFLIPAFRHATQVSYLKEAVYFKRHITRANNQLLEEEMNELLKVYDELKEKYDDILIQKFLDELLLNFYRKKLIVHFKESSHIDQLFERLSQALQKVNDQVIANYDWVLNKEVAAIQLGKIRKYKRINRNHHFLRNLRAGLRTRRRFYIFLYNQFFTKLPIRKKLIFLESFLGKNYSDSPKYIYEYLKNEKERYKFVWSYENEKLDITGRAKQVKRGSLRYLYYVARAKYWVTNARMPNDIAKRKETIYLQTWHGTPLKKLAGDLHNVAMPGTNLTTYKRNFSNETKKWDYLSSPNAYSSEIFRRAFWFNKEMLEFGYPRNDILYQKNNEKAIKQLKEKMNVPQTKKIILYAPTWRDDEYYGVGEYKFALKLNLEKMRQTLGEDYVVVLRMHYLIASQINVAEYDGFVYDFSNYDDISELYLVSDILITDYSSVFFDYANLQRPILFFTYDLEKYRDQLRGFYLDIEKDLPGPLLMESDEVIEAIENINHVKQTYEKRYAAFYEKFCKWDDGNAAEQTVKTVFKQ